MTDTDVECLPNDPRQLKELLKTTFRSSREEIERLKFQLLLAQRARFGSRSERHAPGTPTLFDLGEADAADASPSDATNSDDAAPNTPASPRRGHRRPIPLSLPRTRVEHRLPDEELGCPCCGETRSFSGWITSDQVDYEPAKLIVIEHARAKYACRHCEEQLVAAPKPAQPIEKGIPAPGLLAAIAVGKFGDHLPLYRLEEILSRSGLYLPRSTQCRWLGSIADLLRPLVTLMQVEILAGRVIWSDDTTIPVLDDERDTTKTGRMWVYIGDLSHRFAVFDYSPDRKGQRPRDFLKGYAGYLQADAYSGYDELVDRGPITEVACWAHARRKFVDAKEVAPIGANFAIARIKELYAIERRASVRGLTGEALASYRQEHAGPKLDALEQWLDEQQAALLPKSPLAQAVRYAINLRVALRRYLEDGALSIDNNLSERTLRCVAVGRKNWLFAGNDRGGKTAAVLLSLIATCKLLSVDPYQYLRDVLTRLPQAGPEPDEAFVRSLLPDAWLAAHPEGRLIERN